MTLHVSEAELSGVETWVSEYLLKSDFQDVTSMLLLGQGWPGASSEHLKHPRVVLILACQVVFIHWPGWPGAYGL